MTPLQSPNNLWRLYGVAPGAMAPTLIKELTQGDRGTDYYQIVGIFEEYMEGAKVDGYTKMELRVELQ